MKFMNQLFKFFILMIVIVVIAGCEEVTNTKENIIIGEESEEITNEEALILAVKNGKLDYYSKPETRIEDAFSNFFHSTNWRCVLLEQSKEGLSGTVEFEGYFTTEDQGTLEIRINFEVSDEDDEYFQIGSLYINDVVQDDGEKNRLASAIYDKMYGQESIYDEQDVTDLQPENIQNSALDGEYEMELIGGAVSEYVIQLAQSVNMGDAIHVQKFLDPNSHFYTQQTDLVHDLYSRDIKEYVIDNQILDIRQLSEDTFEVDSYEQIEIVKQGTQEVKDFNWTYTVIYDGMNYLISNLK